MTGSVTSSSAMFTRLRCPPESTFFSGLPICRFLHPLEAEVAERLVDAAVDLLLGVVGRQAEARRVLHGLEDRELGVHDVVLRDVADAPAERVVDGVEVLAVDAHLPAGGRQVAVEREQQRGLAGARGAHQRDHVARQRLEGDVVEQDLHLRPCRRDPAPRERGPTPRSRRVGLPAQSAWSSTTTSTRLSADVDEQRHRADEDLLAAGDRHPLARREPLPAYERAVRAAAVLEEELVAGLHDLRVLRADLRVIDDDLCCRVSDRSR